MKPLPIAVASAIVAWILVFALFIPAPVEMLPGDSVIPVTVYAGQTITVSRNFRAKRDVHVWVVREMVRGDCAKSCEVLSLDHSSISIKKGEYHNRMRTHTIPLAATPGIWKLTFSLNYSGIFGRTATIPLVPLEIEVLP